MEHAETILVVDDAEAIRKILRTMLSQMGYVTLTAEDGVEALRSIEENPAVKLVITDMIMPQMSGAELARRLAHERPDLRIIFMSGYMDDPAVRSLERSSACFLAKPFAAAALREKVREVLAQPWKGLPENGPWAALGTGSR